MKSRPYWYQTYSCVKHSLQGGSPEHEGKVVVYVASYCRYTAHHKTTHWIVHVGVTGEAPHREVSERERHLVTWRVTVSHHVLVDIATTVHLMQDTATSLSNQCIAIRTTDRQADNISRDSRRDRSTALSAPHRSHTPGRSRSRGRGGGPPGPGAHTTAGGQLRTSPSGRGGLEHWMSHLPRDTRHLAILVHLAEPSHELCLPEAFVPY